MSAPIVRLAEPVVPVAWAGSPFGCYSGDVYRDLMPAGLSLAEIATRVPKLPRDFAATGEICVNGRPVPRALWRRVRPRADGPVPVAVTLHVPMGDPGGGRAGGGGKNTLAVVAAIALIAATGFVGAGGLAFLGPAFAAGAFGAQVAAAGIGLVGSLAIAALTAPPARAEAPGNDASKEPASASGNVLQPGGPIPRVVGTHRVFPPLAAEPLIELSDWDEFVTATYCLAGPHELADIRAGSASIADAEDIEFETRTGWSNEQQPTLHQVQSHTVNAAIELTKHQLQDDQSLKDQTTPANSLPVWHRVIAGDSPDEIQLHLYMPQGFYRGDSPDDDLDLPLRIRMRRKGDSEWVNIPELHFHTARAGAQPRLSINLKWDQTVPAFASQTYGTGFNRAWKLVPKQTNTNPPTGVGGWAAHSHFDNGGSSGDVMTETSAGGLQNIRLFYDRVDVYLNSSVIPKGRYEIEVKRGSAFRTAGFDEADYSVIGFNLWYDYFGYTTAAGVHKLEFDVSNQLVDQLVWARCVSRWNANPIAANSGLALITVKARNRAIAEVSALASGLVPALPLGGSPSYVTTSNPAPHFRDVLAGSLNRRALSAEMIDDDAIAAWFDRCQTAGRQCNAIMDGRSVGDALTLLASCGFARPYKSEVWGVIEDRDRSAESPVQIFSPHNLSNFRFEKAFPVLPDHFIATYRDEDDDFADGQVVVYHDSVNASSAELGEAVDVAGLTTAAAVTERLRFDLRQGRLRGTFYSGEAAAENVVCRRGDLVGVQHDVLDKQAGSGRIKSVTRSSDSPTRVTGLVLDSAVPIRLNDSEGEAGSTRTGCAIRLKNGTIIVHELAGSGYSATLTFATPFDDPGDPLGEGCLVVTGELAQEYKRLIVAAVRPGPDLTALLTFVDEAPALHLAGWLVSGRATIRITGTGAAATATLADAHSASGNATIRITATATAIVTGGQALAASANATIRITAAAAATVQGNAFAASANATIRITGAATAAVTGDQHSASANANIRITGAATATVQNNAFTASGNATIRITATATAIVTGGQALAASANATIRITASAAATVQGNAFAASANATIRITGAAAATVQGNAFTASGNATIRITGAATATDPDAFSRAFKDDAFK